MVFHDSLEYWIMPTDIRNAKARLYDAWASTAKALASPRRLELLDILAQGERTVDAIAHEAGLAINNTSAHLKVLKTARLVESRKTAPFVFYRLADDAVIPVLSGVQTLARRCQREVDELARASVDARDSLEPIDMPELRRRLRSGDVTLIDVRPSAEYEAGHIAGAKSIPLDRLARGLPDISKRRPSRCGILSGAVLRAVGRCGRDAPPPRLSRGPPRGRTSRLESRGLAGGGRRRAVAARNSPGGRRWRPRFQPNPTRIAAR